MRNVFAALALVLIAASGGCHRNTCLSTCEKNAKALGCRSEPCKVQCQTLHTSPVCLTEMTAFETCFLKEPTAHWMCDEDEIPALSLDYCRPERAKVVDCLSRVTPASAGGPAKH